MHREEEFNVILHQYTPMIIATINKWRLYSEQEEYTQVARIALYEAWLRFDETAGSFAPYAKSYIEGRIRHELTRRDKVQTNTFPSAPEIFVNAAELSEQNIETTILLTDVIARAGLTPREKDWASSYILENMKPADISEKFGVSVTTVKSWRKTALVKLQRLQPLWKK